MYPFCHLCFMFVFVILSYLIRAALWSPTVIGLTLALLYVTFSCVFVTFSYDVLVKVWFLIVSIPNPCLLPYLSYSMYPCESNGGGH